MHKLGDELKPEEKKEEIRRILTARRKLYNAGVELLECDRAYAESIKAELSLKGIPLPIIWCLLKVTKQRKSKLMKPMFASILKCECAYM